VRWIALYKIKIFATYVLMLTTSLAHMNTAKINITLDKNNPANRAAKTSTNVFLHPVAVIGTMSWTVPATGRSIAAKRMVRASMNRLLYHTALQPICPKGTIRTSFSENNTYIKAEVIGTLPLCYLRIFPGLHPNKPHRQFSGGCSDVGLICCKGLRKLAFILIAQASTPISLTGFPASFKKSTT
jgi:hypothetical protein